MARQFLPALFGGQQRGSSATAHATAGSVASIAGAYGSVWSDRGGWDVDRAINEGLERVMLIMRCVDAMASNQADRRMVLRRGDPLEGPIVPNARLFNMLNRRANSYEVAWNFRYRASGNLLLSKRGLFIETVKDQEGTIRQLHVLPSNLVEPIPDEDEFVSGYKLTTAKFGQVEIPKDRVIWIKAKPHPTDPYLQLTPLTAAGIIADTDFLARLFNRNFLLNDGRPGLLVNVQGDLDPKDGEELRRRLSGGPQGAGRTTVIEADGINVMDLGASPRDMQWLEALNATKNDILLAFGTPESVLGNASGRTYDNADAEKENWWEETESGHCNAFARGLDPLTGSDTDDLFLSIDYDDVDVMQRRKRARHDKLREELQAGTITIDDYREGTGRDRWNVPGTRALVTPMGVLIGRDPDDQEAIANLPIIGVGQQNMLAQGQQPNYGQMAVGSAQLNSMVLQRAQQLAIGSGANANGGSGSSYTPSRFYQQQSDAGNYKDDDDDLEYKDDEVIEGEVVEAINPNLIDILATEGEIAGLIEGWSNDQGRYFEMRLGSVKVRQHTRHWDGERPRGFRPELGYKALDASYVVDTNKWSTQLQTDMDRLMQRVAEKAIKKAAREMHEGGIARAMHAKGAGNASGRTPGAKVFGSTNAMQQAVSDLIRPLNDVVAEAAKNQSARIAEKIQQLDASGASLGQIQTEVKNMISQRSPWKQQLAQYVTTALFEGAKHAAYSKAGKLVIKHWNTQEDERVRPTHAAVDGETRPVGKSFKVGKARMQYPCAPGAPISESAGCRCWTDYSIAPEAEDWFVQHA